MGITLFIGHTHLLPQLHLHTSYRFFHRSSPSDLQCRIRKLFASLMAKHQTQTVYMRHTTGDPGFPVSVLSMVFRRPPDNRNLHSVKNDARNSKAPTGCFQKFWFSFVLISYLLFISTNLSVSFSLDIILLGNPTLFVFFLDSLDSFDRLTKKENAPICILSYQIFNSITNGHRYSPVLIFKTGDQHNAHFP